MQPEIQTPTMANDTKTNQPDSAATGAAAVADGRRTGRRRKHPDEKSLPGINREMIIAHAVSLAQNEPVTEITMVRLGRELGVAPGLIHYFMGSRDELLSAVFNQALKERTESFPPLTGNWRQDAEAHMRHQHEMQLKWKGMTTYVAAHNRNRLFQTVSEGETDFGLVFFDRLGRILQSSGMTREKAARAYHLLMLFTLSVANAHVNRQHPAEHRNYLMGYLGNIDTATYPGASFLAEEFSKIDAAVTFDSGLKVLLDSFEGWVSGRA